MIWKNKRFYDYLFNHELRHCEIDDLGISSQSLNQANQGSDDFQLILIQQTGEAVGSEDRLGHGI